MSQIHYITGDATRPTGSGHKIIAHCCNDIGAWGAGFVLALSKRWRQPRQRYSESCGMLALGAVQFVEVEADITVANIIGQHGCGFDEQGRPPIRYEALRKGFGRVAEWAAHVGASVHMPRVGCGLAGGDWAVVEDLICSTLILRKVPVFVYDLPTVARTNNARPVLCSAGNL